MCAALALLASHGLAQSVKLNGPLVQPVGGTIYQFEISPDATRIVYLADQDVDEVFELYSVPLDESSAPVKLNGPMLGDVELENGFAISPDSSRVVYRANPEGGAVHLYGVPIDGSASPLLLDLPAEGASGGDTEPYFVFSPLGDYVILFNEDASLHSAPIDGGSGAMLVGGYVPQVAFTPDGTHVLYLSSATPPWRRQLYTIPVDGSAGPIQLNGELQVAGDVSSFALHPDGSRVLYAADQDTNGMVELYGAASDGSGTPVKLSAPLSPIRDVGRFWFGSDGSTAVYTVDLDTRVQLYGVPSDGSASAVALNSIPGPSSGILQDFLPLPELGRVVYRADHASAGVYELFSLAIEGSLPPSRLNGALAAGGDVYAFQVSADGSRIVYFADQDEDDVYELFSVPVESRFPRKLRRPGTPPPVQLNGPLVAGGDALDWKISLDGGWVVYRADQDENDVVELYSVPIQGGEPVQLNDALPAGGDLSRFAVGSGGQVGFLAPGTAGVGLFGVPVDRSAQPTLLSRPMPFGPSLSDVHAFALGPLGDRAVYLADEDRQSTHELYVTRVDGLGTPVKLNAALVAGGDVGGGNPIREAFQFSPDGARIAYMADQDTPDVVDLYLTSSGGGTPLRLTTGASVMAGFRFVPDGSRIVHRALTGPAKPELFSVPTDGSAAPVRLNGPLVGGAEVASFEIGAGGSRVVYLSNEDLATRYELFSTLVDGSASPVRLHGALASNRDVTTYALGQDGSRVVYLVDSTSDSVFELFSVPVDRSSPPVKLNAAPGTGHDVATFVISPDGARVVYVATQLSTESELYAAPSDGSSAGIKLCSMLPGRDVLSAPQALAISPDSTRVVFVADRDADEEFKLLSVPIDGSSAAVQLNGPLAPGGDVGSFPDYFAISPDGARVVYLADQDVNGALELYSVLIQGGSRHKLNAPFVAGQAIESFAIDSRSAHVVYVADQETDNVRELYRVPIDAGEGPEKLSGPIPGLYNTMSFAITPDARRVLYRGDQEAAGIVELFATVADKMRPAADPDRTVELP